MNLHAFTVLGIGRLAKQPEIKQKDETTYCNFVLIGNDHAGPNRPPARISLNFTAFGKAAEALCEHSRKGDQLFVYAHMKEEKYQEGTNTHYRHTYIVDGFQWGAPGPAKRAEFAASSGSNRSEDARQ